MTDPRALSRRAALLGALAAAGAGLSACGSSSGSSSAAPPAVPPATSASSGGDPLAAVYSSAPVADASAITAGSTMAAIKQRGTLRVGAALDAPLLSQQDPTDPDSIQGFDIDLAKLLATYIIGKPSVQVVPPASETREALLSNGTVDVVFNTYTITEQRAQQISFAGPYLTSGLAVAVKKGSSITGVDDLGGKTVIVGANTPAVTAVPQRQPTAKVVSFATDPQAVQALLQGRGDAYVQDFTLLAADAVSDTSLQVVGQPFTSEAYGIGLKHDDATFKSFVNTWLKATEDSGTWAKVYAATLGSVTSAATPTPPAIGSVPGS